MNNEIRFFHRLINFNSTPAGRKKCEASLRHMLRIMRALKLTKQLEWDPELSKNNLTHSYGRTQALDNFEEDYKWEKLFSIAPEPKIRNQTKLQNQRRQYKDKIKKAIKSEENAGNTQACEFLREILEQKDFVRYSMIDDFARLKMTRSKQRIKMLEVYLNAHNQLSSRPPNENGIFIQEGIFKIPHRWNIGSDKINTHEYMAFTLQFLKDNYPNYNVELIAVHDDERPKEVTTGIHSHYFINGRNKVTGQYDLRRRQIEIVNQYLRDNELHQELFPENGKMNYKQSKLLGHFYQRVVQDYTNKHLLIPKGLEATFSDEAEKASEVYKNMVKQAKRPKSEREFNFYNHQIEEYKKQLEMSTSEIGQLDEQKQNTIEILGAAITKLDEVDDHVESQRKELEKLEAQKSDAQDDLNAMGMRYLALENDFANKRDELTYVEKELEHSEYSLKEINHEVEQSESRLKQITNESTKRLESIIESVYKVLFVKYKGNAAFVDKFTKELMLKINQHIPEPLQPILKGVLKLSKEKEIFKDL